MHKMSMAGLAKHLVEEKKSNKTLRKKLANALCKQTAQDNDLIQLRFDKDYLTKRLKSKDEQIAEQNEELFELRTQVAALTDCLKQRAYSGPSAKTVAKQADGPSGGASGRWKRLTRRKVTDGTD